MSRLSGWAASLALALVSVSASAQDACPGELARAQDLYVQGEFADVEEILDPCLQPGRLGQTDQVRAHRLLALSALQTGRLVDAKLAVLTLLRLQPQYDADPALDPPVYTDLVGTVRRQLAVEAPRRVATDTARVAAQAARRSELAVDLGDAPEPEAYTSVSRAEADGRELRRSRAVELNYWSGFIHYASDLGGGSVTDGYFLYDAPRLGLQVGYAPARALVLGLGVETAYFSRFAQSGPVRGSRATSDAFVVQATLDGRFRAGADARLSPYLGLGVSTILVAEQQEARVALAPAASLGLDVWAGSGLSLFLEATASVPFPTGAFAEPSGETVGLFSGARVGVRSYFRR